MADRRKNGHWKFDGVLSPEDYYGFVYLIRCKVNGKEYVGRKQYYHYRKRKRVRETNWKAYTGSSKDLNEDIKQFGKRKFEFIVLKQYKTRGWFVYGEANYQHKLDVLTERLPDGTRKFYNKQIGAVRFVPSPDKE